MKWGFSGFHPNFPSSVQNLAGFLYITPLLYGRRQHFYFYFYFCYFCHSSTHVAWCSTSTGGGPPPHVVCRDQRSMYWYVPFWLAAEVPTEAATVRSTPPSPRLLAVVRP